MPAQTVIHRLFTEPEETEKPPLPPLNIQRLSRKEKWQRLICSAIPQKPGPVKALYSGEFKTIQELAYESQLRYENGKVGWEK